LGPGKFFLDTELYHQDKHIGMYLIPVTTSQ
jgi:hypothetical protein